jgi:hypothetical protein
MKCKVFLCLVFYFIFCSFFIFKDCPLLNVLIASNDRLSQEDSNFGAGDDDLFTGDDDCKIYTLRKGVPIKTRKLNDYNLQTAYEYKPNMNNKEDTLIAFFDLPGFRSRNDTILIIDELNIFNGNRKSITDWKKSVKAKNIQLLYRDKCIGNLTLKNTYKMQTIKLRYNSLVVKGGERLKIIVTTTYDSLNLKKGYSLSEITFSGIKKYD